MHRRFLPFVICFLALLFVAPAHSQEKPQQVRTIPIVMDLPGLK